MYPLSGGSPRRHRTFAVLPGCRLCIVGWNEATDGAQCRLCTLREEESHVRVRNQFR